MRKYLLIIGLLILFNSAIAIKVGLVVEFPEGEIFTKCLEVEEETNAYEILEMSKLNLTWSYHSSWGHALCAINEVGCPSSNCFCSSEYWNFYIKKYGETSWKYSPTGFDGGSSCSEHYCASSRDLLGFGYGVYGTKPKLYSFEEICPFPERKERRSYKVSIKPKEPKRDEFIKINIQDSKTFEGIKNAEVELFLGYPGTSKRLFYGKTNDNGSLEIPPQEEGTYRIRINVPRYHPSQSQYELTIHKLTPSLTSSTLFTTSSTTSTTTITKLSTSLTSSSIISTSTISTTSSPQLLTSLSTLPPSSEKNPPLGEATKFSPFSKNNLLAVLISLLILFFLFKKFKNK